MRPSDTILKQTKCHIDELQKKVDQGIASLHDKAHLQQYKDQYFTFCDNYALDVERWEADEQRRREDDAALRERKQEELSAQRKAELDRRAVEYVRAGFTVAEVREMHGASNDWPGAELMPLLEIAKKEYSVRIAHTKAKILEVAKQCVADCGLSPGVYNVKLSESDAREIRVADDGSVEVRKIQQSQDVSEPIGAVRSGSNQKESATVVSTQCPIVLDGSNVIGIDGALRTKILRSIVVALCDAGYKCKVFVDKTIFGWLRNKMGDEVGAEYLADAEKNGLVVVSPNKAEADGQILQLAEFEKNVHIITNDRYRDYAELHPWLNDRSAANRLHGINVVPMGDGRHRILIAGFNLDIIVRA